MPDSDVFFLSAAHGAITRLLDAIVEGSSGASGARAEAPSRLARDDALSLARALGGAVKAQVYAESIACAGRAVYAAAKDAKLRRAVVRASKVGREGPKSGSYALDVRPWTASVAESMRERLPFLRPGPLGGGASVGLGDRLGCATVGHARAAGATELVPAFAQQSAREMSRTGRSPSDVLDDATWGVFVSGWRRPWGADADHLKTIEDIDRCASAGFVTFTLDPSDCVDDAASTDPADVLRRKLDAAPWGALETTLADCRRRHVGGADHADEEAFARAAAKYCAAIARAAELARHVASRLSPRPFEIEISLDETSSPTTPFEHRFVALELARLGVRPASVAVRFVGEFEKGVDYKGDLERLARDAESHAEVARELGPYKLSVHSGSDKFSAYPVLARAARGAIHLKTAGTSWLEALRTVAETDLGLFCEIVAVARARYAEDRKSYHVSARCEDLPAAELTEASARGLLDRPGARQVLHVTYGSVLAARAASGETLGEEIRRLLDQNEELHWANVERHLARHLEPFAARRMGSDRQGEGSR